MRLRLLLYPRGSEGPVGGATSILHSTIPPGLIWPCGMDQLQPQNACVPVCHLSLLRLSLRLDVPLSESPSVSVK